MTICANISTTRAYTIRTDVSLSPSFGDVPLSMFLFEVTLQLWSSLDTHLGCCSEYVRRGSTSVESFKARPMPCFKPL